MPKIQCLQGRLGTCGKSPGELPDWKRVGPAKAAEMLGPAITQEADAGLHARGFAPRTLHSTNPLERLNKEVKRRADVVGIFPCEASITRLIGAVLLEQNDEWQLQHRYMQVE